MKGSKAGEMTTTCALLRRTKTPDNVRSLGRNKMRLTLSMRCQALVYARLAATDEWQSSSACERAKYEVGTNEQWSKL